MSKEVNLKSVNEKASGYTNKGLTFGENGGWQLFMPFELKYTFIKKDGTDSREQTKKTSMFPAFCPFCGKKILKDK